MIGWIAKLMGRMTRLEKELEVKNRHLTLLYDISRALSGTLDSDDFYSEMAEIVGCMLDFDELVLMLYNDRSRKLRVVATYGIDDPGPLMGMAFDCGEGITGETIANKEAIYVPDTSKDKRYLYYKGLKPSDGALYSVPILNPEGHQAIGVINVSRPTTEAFSQQERETLRAVSHLIGMQIANAQLFCEIKEQSVKDALTELYNRRDGEDAIKREFNRSQRFDRQFSVMIIDIDHFKKYNDRYGHPQGDVILKEFAALVSSTLRDVDYIARWGGEEFLVILPNTEESGAVQVAEKICRNVRRHPFPKRSSQPKRHFTVSIGVATYPEQGQSVDTLIEAADKALYDAKGAGRDQVGVAEAIPVKKRQVG